MNNALLSAAAVIEALQAHISFANLVRTVENDSRCVTFDVLVDGKTLDIPGLEWTDEDGDIVRDDRHNDVNRELIDAVHEALPDTIDNLDFDFDDADTYVAFFALLQRAVEATTPSDPERDDAPKAKSEYWHAFNRGRGVLWHTTRIPVTTNGLADQERAIAEIVAMEDEVSGYKNVVEEFGYEPRLLPGDDGLVLQLFTSDIDTDAHAEDEILAHESTVEARWLVLRDARIVEAEKAYDDAFRAFESEVSAATELWVVQSCFDDLLLAAENTPAGCDVLWAAESILKRSDWRLDADGRTLVHKHEKRIELLHAEVEAWDEVDAEELRALLQEYADSYEEARGETLDLSSVSVPSKQSVVAWDDLVAVDADGKAVTFTCEGSLEFHTQQLTAEEFGEFPKSGAYDPDAVREIPIDELPAALFEEVDLDTAVGEPHETDAFEVPDFEVLMLGRTDPVARRVFVVLDRTTGRAGVALDGLDYWFDATSVEEALRLFAEENDAAAAEFAEAA